jgi:hypothetical protein
MSDTPPSRAAVLAYEMHVKTVLARYKQPVHDLALDPLRELVIKARALALSPQHCALLVLTAMSRREDATRDQAMQNALCELNKTWPSDDRT